MAEGSQSRPQLRLRAAFAGKTRTHHAPPASGRAAASSAVIPRKATGGYLPFVVPPRPAKHTARLCMQSPGTGKASGSSRAALRRKQMFLWNERRIFFLRAAVSSGDSVCRRARRPGSPAWYLTSEVQCPPSGRRVRRTQFQLSASSVRSSPAFRRFSSRCRRRLRRSVRRQSRPVRRSADRS